MILKASKLYIYTPPSNKIDTLGSLPDSELWLNKKLSKDIRVGTISRHLTISMNFILQSAQTMYGKDAIIDFSDTYGTISELKDIKKLQIKYK